MTWGVIQHDGKIIHYIIEGERVKAYEVGQTVEYRTPELLEAIEADVIYQRGKHERDEHSHQHPQRSGEAAKR